MPDIYADTSDGVISKSASSYTSAREASSGTVNSSGQGVVGVAA